MVIRSAVADDAHGIAQLLVDSWRSAYEGILPDELLAGLSVAERHKQLAAALAAPKPAGAVRLVAQLQGVIIGFANAGVIPPGGMPATGRVIKETADDAVATDGADPGAGNAENAGPTRRTGELAVLYVAPDHWREGVGRRLVRRVLSSLAAADCTDVNAWVVDGNDPAFAFFRRQGWTLSGARRTEVLDGHLVRQSRMDVRLAD